MILNTFPNYDIFSKTLSKIFANMNHILITLAVDAQA
jgi:hypothetical protein